MAGTYLLAMVILFLNKFTKQLLRFKKKIEFPMPQQKAVSKIFTRTKKIQSIAITNSENRKQSESHTQIKKHSYQRPSKTSFDKWLLLLFTAGRIAQYSRHRQNKQNSCNPLQPHNVVIQSQQKCAEDKKCRQLHIP